ncbi:hypothetical protein LX36DRAFT_651906 [Colletotrichum falcatum]|nr:hypothetical protein LX36DRAFT_651906 [Colletotrichum falcatum]
MREARLPWRGADSVKSASDADPERSAARCFDFVCSRGADYTNLRHLSWQSPSFCAPARLISFNPYLPSGKKVNLLERRLDGVVRLLEELGLQYPLRKAPEMSPYMYRLYPLQSLPCAIYSLGCYRILSDRSSNSDEEDYKEFVFWSV